MTKIYTDGEWAPGGPAEDDGTWSADAPVEADGAWSPRDADLTDVHAVIKAGQRSYFEAIGEFVLFFGVAETSLYRVLWHYCGMSETAARSVFSGTRLRTMIDSLKTLRENGLIGDGRWRHLEPLLAQLAVINTARDRLIHYGVPSALVDAKDGPLQVVHPVSNTMRGGRVAKIFVEFWRAADVSAMKQDCEVISMALAMHVAPSADDAWAQSRVPRTPWQYRPQPPTAPSR